MLRQRADRELPDDLHAARVDHVDRVAVAVRDVDARECASRGAAEHVRTVRGIDVDGRRRAGACRTGVCRTGESEHRRLRSVRAPTARDEDAGAERDRRRIGERLSQVTRGANPSGARVDRLDPGGRSVEARSASSDHVREAAQLGRGCMSGRPGQAPEPAEHSARGRVLEDPRARLPVRQRPARDDELAARRRDGRVAHGRRQMGDDPRSAAGRPRDDGVEPVRPGEAADDVRRPADRGCGLVRARGRKAADDASADADDLVVLPRAVASAEQVHRSAELRRSCVVHRGRQASGCAFAVARDHAHGVGRRVRSGQPSEQHRAGAVERDGGRILERRIEPADTPGSQRSSHHRAWPVRIAFAETGSMRAGRSSRPWACRTIAPVTSAPMSAAPTRAALRRVAR